MFGSTILVGLLAQLAAGTPLVERAAPTVQLDQATVTGTTTGVYSKFQGIPFAKPPTGDRRFRLPEAIDPYTTSFTATEFGPSCPQQAVNLPIQGLPGDAVNWLVNTVYLAVLPDDEDCLTINVVKPANATADSKLPVGVWIFGGGFELGGVQYYPGETLVSRSLELGTPMVYVSLNYRVTGFGFMPGQEIKDAGVGNLGLQDQREALRWVNKYIGAFGGDKDKVTIFGESAGAISVALHMITNDGDTEGLFRGAFMQSGSPIPVGDIAHGQQYYDDVVERTGCSNSSDSLQCLREVDYKTLKDAINQTPGIFSYQSLSLAYLPRTDGVFLKDDPQALVGDGVIADIPFVNGDCDDEGTLFSLTTLNITTDDELVEWIKTYWIPSVTEDQVEEFKQLYPEDPTQGSPYDTGILSTLSPNNKRIASFQGDAVFQAPRRYFLDNTAGKQNVWSYINKRLKVLPVLGAAHGTDIPQMYAGGEIADYFIRFTTNLDPNVGGNPSKNINWPKYDTSARTLLTFLDGLIPLTTSKDDFRAEAMEFITSITLRSPLRIGGGNSTGTSA